MQATSLSRRNAEPLPATQQRFSFGQRASNFAAAKRHRAAFLSDAHLGTRGCNAQALLNFLRENDFERLYIVGDLIDIWSLRRGIYWPQQHNDVIQKILRKARKGTRVIYIPGNHDELVAGFCGVYGNIEIRRSAVHITASGERILIIHGHELDTVVSGSGWVRWLAFAGDLGYQFLLSLNPLINFIRRRFGLGYWSLSAYAKRRVKDAVSFIGKFEAAVARYAECYGVDAVLCGHIHSPCIREFGDITYYNCGDWVESCTALVEADDGMISLVGCDPFASVRSMPACKVRAAAAGPAAAEVCP
ncbi:MAG: UDP-2,3-diacylglucosamine diphosphatase [Chthoniobacterales bacterium]|jgi:UDP-2,3-diacylglucosamine pyrophosphatase LpxH|nr:UDP-2,3-diacylglucosamine diphosphatase [Chthoniobacterales bacterium]